MIVAGLLAGVLALAPAGCVGASASDNSPAAASSAPLQVTGSEVVTDFAQGVPTDYQDATVSLQFENIRPLGDNAGAVVVQLQRRNGKWAAEGHSAAADYNERSRETSVEIVEASMQDDTVRGRIQVKIGPDGARRGREHFPTPPDQFEISFTGEVQDDYLKYQRDRESFMPSWRKDVPRFGGRRITGTYEATWTWKDESNERSGEILGALSHATVPGKWGTDGNAAITPAGGGMRILARLSPERVATGASAWAMHAFGEPVDWSGWDGLRVTIRSQERRDDAAVAVGLQQGPNDQGKPGPWYSVAQAVPIREGQSSNVVLFEDFGYGWRRPDTGRIATLQIGVSDPHGVGEVEYVVEQVELVRVAGQQEPDSTVRLSIDPQTAMSFNGAREIPKGLFGFHGYLSDKEPDKKEGKLPPLEYYGTLDPGYARKITHTGFGAKPVTEQQVAEMRQERIQRVTEPDKWAYRRAKAGNMVDNVVQCHSQDLWARPGWMNEGLEEWTERMRTFYRRQGAMAWVPGDEHNILRKLEVWNEPFMWGRHINMGWRNPPGQKVFSDPTQYGYIPAKLGAEAYCELYEAAWEGARSVNKHVKIGGPSSPAFNADDFGVLENYVARIIDRLHDKLDFLTEHHYGGNPKETAGAYEVVTAYCDVKHGKRIPIYNTECNDLGASNAGKAAYNMLDILHLIRTSPDKAKGRAMHYFGGDYLGNEGEEHCYKLLAG
ncbi:MAG: hypothetical protein ACOC93_01600, partial [Planctomycetota bacterium]